MSIAGATLTPMTFATMLGLAAGTIYQGQSGFFRAFMNQKNWLFSSPEDTESKVTAPAKQGYENDPTIDTAKILLR